MSRVHFIGGEKGGVGKSVIARLIAQYLIDRAISFQAFDTDPSPGSLGRCYPEYTTRVDVREYEQLDLIVEALEDHTEEVLVDLAARTRFELDQWVASGDVLRLLARLGHRVWYWYVIDQGQASVRLLSRFLDQADPEMQLVCVRNHGRGSDFRLFDESKLEERIRQMGGEMLDLPALHPASMLKIDAYDKSFWAALHNTNPDEGPCLSLMQRERAKVFIRSAHQQFREKLSARGDGAFI